MFFGDSGSIAGDDSDLRPDLPSRPLGTYRMCQTHASLPHLGSSPRSGPGWLGGRWQRQIQRFACPAATARTDGCGSWTMITSQSSLIARQLVDAVEELPARR
jgi:hypothetical protein